MKLDNATRTELHDLYHNMRDAKEIFNEACEDVANKTGKKPPLDYAEMREAHLRFAKLLENNKDEWN